MADSDKENMEDLAYQVNNVSLNDNDLGMMHTDDTATDMELPNTLIITNVSEAVFEDARIKEEFECIFREFDNSATFQYLKSFRRARVIYGSPLTAAKTRIHAHEREFCGRRVKCYFAQPQPDKDSDSPHLRPPVATKQFLISPPASPPVGWEPVTEGTPVVNYDLLSAIANLAPGESHELHPPSASQPGIVVHVCEDPAGFENRPKLMQVRCPERRS